MEPSKEAGAELLEKRPVAVRKRGQLLGSAMPFGRPIGWFRVLIAVREQTRVEVGQLASRLFHIGDR
jgi:hypothetical protein